MSDAIGQPRALAEVTEESEQKSKLTSLRGGKKLQTKPANKVAWYWNTQTETPTEHHVLGAIVQMYNKQHRRAWPSIELLAKMTGLSVRTVGRVNKSLEAQGIIEIEPHVNEETGARENNRYYLPGFDSLSHRTARIPVRIQHYRNEDDSAGYKRFDYGGEPIDD